MRLKHSFLIAAPPEHVWPALTDIRRIAQCLPGAEIGSVRRDGMHHGRLDLKLGPTAATYRGRVRVQEIDEASRTVVMLVSGPRRSGQVAATVMITSRTRPHAGGTRVDVAADLDGETSLAQRGLAAVAQKASQPLLREFADRLAMIADSEGDSSPSRRTRRPRAAARTPAGPPARPPARAASARIDKTPSPARRPWLAFAVLWRRARTLRGLAGRFRAPRSGDRSVGVEAVARGGQRSGSALSSACPHCGARAGEVCRTRSGHVARAYHASRVRTTVESLASERSSR